MSIKSLLPFGRTTDVTQGAASDPFTAMRRDMDRLFEDFSRGMSLPAGFSGTGMLSPKVNVSETKKGLEITAELPGIDEKDIDVDLDDGILTLKAEHKAEKEELPSGRALLRHLYAPLRPALRARRRQDRGEVREGRAEDRHSAFGRGREAGEEDCRQAGLIKCASP